MQYTLQSHPGHIQLSSPGGTKKSKERKKIAQSYNLILMQPSIKIVKNSTVSVFECYCLAMEALNTSDESHDHKHRHKVQYHYYQNSLWIHIWHKRSAIIGMHNSASNVLAL